MDEYIKLDKEREEKRKDIIKNITNKLPNIRNLMDFPEVRDAKKNLRNFEEAQEKKDKEIDNAEDPDVRHGRLLKLEMDDFTEKLENINTIINNYYVKKNDDMVSCYDDEMLDIAKMNIFFNSITKFDNIFSGFTKFSEKYKNAKIYDENTGNDVLSLKKEENIKNFEKKLSQTKKTIEEMKKTKKYNEDIIKNDEIHKKNFGKSEAEKFDNLLYLIKNIEIEINNSETIKKFVNDLETTYTEKYIDKNFKILKKHVEYRIREIRQKLEQYTKAEDTKAEDTIPTKIRFIDKFKMQNFKPNFFTSKNNKTETSTTQENIPSDEKNKETIGIINTGETTATTTGETQTTPTNNIKKTIHDIEKTNNINEQNDNIGDLVQYTLYIKNNNFRAIAETIIDNNSTHKFKKITNFSDINDLIRGTIPNNIKNFDLIKKGGSLKKRKINIRRTKKEKTSKSITKRKKKWINRKSYKYIK
jgi:hypothetical protein